MAICFSNIDTLSLEKEKERDEEKSGFHSQFAQTSMKWERAVFFNIFAFLPAVSLLTCDSRSASPANLPLRHRYFIASDPPPYVSRLGRARVKWRGLIATVDYRRPTAPVDYNLNKVSLILVRVWRVLSVPINIRNSDRASRPAAASDALSVPGTFEIYTRVRIIYLVSHGIRSRCCHLARSTLRTSGRAFVHYFTTSSC